MTESSCTTDVTTLSEVPHLQLTHSHQHYPGGIYTGHTVAPKGAPLAHVAWSAELASSQLAVQSQ